MAGYILGKSTPTIESIVKIAESNDISLDWLITGKGDMNQPDPLTLNFNGQQKIKVERSKNIVNLANGGAVSGTGDVTTGSDGLPAPPGIHREDLNDLEYAAITALRDISPASAALLVEAIQLFSEIGRRLELEDWVGFLREQREEHRQKHGR